MSDLFELIREYEPALSEWECLGEIGRGRFGVVYKIQKNIGHTMEKQTAALKIVEFDSSALETERNMINIIDVLKNEPHAVSIDDYFKVSVESPSGDKTDYLALRMELLSELPKSGIREEEAICLAVDMCDILMTCHGRRPAIYHCDIKPDNILVSPDGSFKLGDFGEAQYKSARHTNASEVGTDGFRAPELYTGKEYDNRCDLYSLGVTLYTLLNGGELPFGDVDSTISSQIKGKRFPRIKGVSSDFMKIIWRLCSRKPSARFESARELTAALLPIVSRRCREEMLLGRTAKRKTNKKTEPVLSEQEVSVQNETAINWNETVTAEDGFLKETVAVSDADYNEYIADAVTETAVSENEEAIPELPQRSLESVYRKLKRMHFSEYYIPFHVKRMTACIIAALLITIGLYNVLVRPYFAYIDGKFITVTTESLDFSNMGVSDVKPLSRCTELTELDITGNDVSVEDFNYLAERLTECRIIWDVPVGTIKIRSDVQSLDTAMLEGNDAYLASVVQYFNQLRKADFTGSAMTYEELIGIREDIPDCDTVWTVELEGKAYSTKEKTLTLSHFDTDVAQTLRCFEQLEWVDLSGSKLSNAELADFRKDYPEYNILWSIMIRGKMLRTDTTTIDLCNLPDINGISQKLEDLQYFTCLEELNLKSSRVTDYSFLRYCTSLKELNIRQVETEDFSVLKNLTNLRKLDIGYNTISDLSFLKSLKKLQYLDMGYCSQIGNADESILLGLDELWYLNIDATPFVYFDLSFLKEMSSLAVLSIYSDLEIGSVYSIRYETLTGIKNLKAFAGEIHPQQIHKILGECKELTVLQCWGSIHVSLEMDDLLGFEQLKCIYGEYVTANTNDLSPLSKLELIAAQTISTRCRTALANSLPECKTVGFKQLGGATFYSTNAVDDLCRIYLPEYFEAMESDSE